MAVAHVRRPEPASIEVDRRPARAPTYEAIVSIAGAHGLLTARQVSDALATVGGDVLVDLTRCASLDAGVIAAIVADAFERARDRQTLELIVPQSNEVVTRAFSHAGVGDLVFVHESTNLSRA